MFSKWKKETKPATVASAPAVLTEVSSEEDNEYAAEIAKGEAEEARRRKTAKEPEYDFEMLWRDLNECLLTAQNYVDANYIKPSEDPHHPRPGSDDPDNVQLKKTFDAICETYRLGVIAEKISIKRMKAKALAGKAAQDVFFNVFGESRMAPIVGVKSRRIVEIAVLPFMECASKIYTPWYMGLACKLLRKFANVEIDLAAEKVAAANIAAKYKRIIAEIKAREEAEEVAQEAAQQDVQPNQEYRSPSPGK